jgi:hypothetical protein
MKHFFSIIALCLACSAASAQDIHIYLTGGLMNYQGDLQAKRITFSQAHPFAGVGLYYEATDKLFFRFGAAFGKLSADDKLGKSNKDRNLNFQSQLLEVQLVAEYDIISSYEHTVVPYIFAGVAGYHFNPYTYDAANKKVYLQPLGTEGQGFFAGRKKYGLTQLAVPVGGGLKMLLSDNVSLRMDVGLRVLFTDYLDDVSDSYADEDELRAFSGQQAVDLAFRGDELGRAVPYPDATAKRGNPKSKDFYYTTGLTLSYRIQGNPNKNRSGNGKTGCPVNVY